MFFAESYVEQTKRQFRLAASAWDCKAAFRALCSWIIGRLSMVFRTGRVKVGLSEGTFPFVTVFEVVLRNRKLRVNMAVQNWVKITPQLTVSFQMKMIIRRQQRALQGILWASQKKCKETSLVSNKQNFFNHPAKKTKTRQEKYTTSGAAPKCTNLGNF